MQFKNNVFKDTFVDISKVRVEIYSSFLTQIENHCLKNDSLSNELKGGKIYSNNKKWRRKK